MLTVLTVRTYLGGGNPQTVTHYVTGAVSPRVLATSSLSSVLAA